MGMMSSSSKTFFYVLIISFLLCYDHCDAYGHVEVSIINDIGTNSYLGLHCKSKTEDLGSQSLVYQQEWKFRASIDFFSTTLYFCHFEWENQSKLFDILIANRDADLCRKHPPCLWKIRPTGPCRETVTEKCFPWNNQ